MSKLDEVRNSCGICGNNNLNDILDFGNVSLAGFFPAEKDINKNQKYPLNIKYCNTCGLVQTGYIINSKKLFEDYRYSSSIGLSDHFRLTAQTYKEKFSLNEKAKILEIGSNDGVLLEPLMDLGIDCLGFDPSINISLIAKKRGCNVIVDYFNEQTCKKYLNEKTYDIVCANNCFAHIEDLHSVLKGVSYCLKNDGYFVIEVHYLKNLVDEIQYDFIYHEHLYYYSLISLSFLFKLHGFSIIDFEKIPTHGGSIRVYCSRDKQEVQRQVCDQMEKEYYCGLNRLDYFYRFSNAIKNHVQEFKNVILQTRQKGMSIAGYGASGRGNMLMNICKIGSEEVSFMVDESPERYGRFMGGVNIPIFNPEHLKTNHVDYMLILAWNYYDAIVEKLKKHDYNYIVPFPKIKKYENN